MILAATFARKGVPAALRDLAAVAEAPPIDPHWNRGLALAWERTEEGDLIEVERYWRAYVDDLAGLECLLPAERTLAQALVWLRLGRLLVEESCPCAPPAAFATIRMKRLKAQAVECFEKSLNAGARVAVRLPGLGRGVRGVGGAGKGGRDLSAAGRAFPGESRFAVVSGHALCEA